MPTRRAPLLLFAVLLLLAGCSSGAGGPTGGEATSGDGAFPVTIEHRFGRTEITGEPARVLSLGYQEHDPILALGITPIAVRHWFGAKTDVIFPWAEDEAAGADPEVLVMPDGLNFEKIAALRPDLILGVYSGMTARDYELLSAIAPTVAQSGEYIDYGTPWQVHTVTVGRALGREDRARELVADLEARFAQVRQAHPGWQGRTAVVATYGENGQFSAFASQDPRSRFFSSLGFAVPAEIDRLAGDSFYVELSPERVGLLDADLLVWDQLSYLPGGEAALRANPLVAQLDAVRDGRAVFLPEQLEYAFAFNTVLSLPFLLDGIVPVIESTAVGATPPAN